MSLKETVKTEHIGTEILIIGGGAAGMAAALTAAERGCSNIIVVDKAGIGGNSAMAHDVFAAESPVQRRMGMDAGRDDFFKIAMEWAHWSKINPRILRAFIDKSGDTIRWLQEKGLNFELGQYFINQIPRVRHVIEGTGAQLMKVLMAKCKELGVKMFTNTPAKEIIRSENGDVTGVLVESNDKNIIINAKSIIITTGGYGNNKELLAKYCPHYNPDNNLNHGVHSNTGDGIFMASEIGAATAGLGHIMFHGPSASSKPSTLMSIGDGSSEIRKYSSALLIREPETLWVNKRGKRFIDEGHNFSNFASATTVAQQPEGIMFTVFDDKVRQTMEEDGLIWTGAYGGPSQKISSSRPLAGEPLPGLGRELHTQVEKGVRLKISDSWDEIADWIGCRPDVLKATVDEYNACCEEGHDSIFCKDRQYLMPLVQTPFYAIRGQAFIGDALGGIKINERMEVLDHEDNPIPGLYAGGSTTGCWESEIYCYKLSGHMLGFALNSGRIAGENATEYSSEKNQ